MRSPERTSLDYLQDIVDYAEKAERFVASVPNAEALASDEKTLLAVVRALEIIGEAASALLQHFARNTLSFLGAAWLGCATRSSMDTSGWMPQLSGRR